jgi:Lamin Tail Domain
MKARSAFLSWAVVCLILNHSRQQVFVSCAASTIIITEIAGKGSSNVCGDGDGSHDWIELHNNHPTDLANLAGYLLHDDKGINDDEAFTFPQDYAALLPGEYRVLCTMGDNATVSPQFAIGGDDVITLVASDGVTAIASVGPLPDTHNEFDITFAWDSDPDSMSVSSIERPAENQTSWRFMGGYDYYYTSTPTPGLPNVLTRVGETADQIKQLLARQNEEGTRFFGMDSQGFPVQDALDPVLDLHLTMHDDDYEYMMKNKGYEVYLPFQSARIVVAANSPEFAPDDEVLSLSSPGQIRTKGQTSLYVATCAGTTTGKQLEKKCSCTTL